MDLSKLTGADLAYLEGFVQKCAAHNISPEELLTKLAKDAQDKSEDKAKKKPSTVKKVLGGAGRGAAAGAGLGAGVGAIGGGLAGTGMALAGGKRMALADKLKLILGATLGGATLGAGSSALRGGLIGGATTAALG